MKVLSDIDVFEKKVFVRADLDVPVGTLMVNGKSLIDDAEQATRLTNLKPTVDYLLEHGASQVIIAGHISSDSLGMNLFLDQLVLGTSKKEG